MFFCKFWEIFKNTYFYRTPLVFASELCTFFSEFLKLLIFWIWEKHLEHFQESVISFRGVSGISANI